MPTASLDSIKSGHIDQAAPTTAKTRVRPHIAYLEFLKAEGLLEQALRGELPKNVERAAKLYVVGGLREKFGKDAVPIIQSGDEICISVSEEEKKTQDQEINDFLRMYGLIKAFEPFIYKVMPREIMKGQKYLVKSGWFKSRPILIKGLDREHFGCRWDANYGNPICEKYMFRIQQDELPVRGLVYVAKLIDEKRDILLHEVEIGDALQ